MWFIQWIIRRLSDISMWFYDLAAECWDAFYVPDIIGYLFYDIHGFFVKLAWDFVDFDDWLEWARDEIYDILSWSNIRSLIRGWLPDIEDLVDWWDRWWVWVGQEIDDWWSSTRLTVRGWIDAAIASLEGGWEDWVSFWNNTWPQWTEFLNNLKAAWDNFWSVTFPTLVSFTWLTTWWNSRLTDIQALINTAFTLRESFWAGWQELRDSVLEFFADPLKWLYDRLEDFMDRYW